MTGVSWVQNHIYLIFIIVAYSYSCAIKKIFDPQFFFFFCKNLYSVGFATLLKKCGHAKVIIPKNTRTGTATEFEVQGDHQNDTN